MNLWELICLIICMAIFCFMVFSFSYKVKQITMLKKQKKSPPTNCDTSNINETAKNKIKILEDDSKDAKQKSRAFIKLMSIAYVLIHTLINEGNKYNDKVQSESFKKSLTPSVVERLNSLEGNYE